METPPPLPVNPVAPSTQAPMHLDVEDDDDDYEPDFYPAEDTEQILNKLDNAPPEEPEPKPKTDDVALGPFTLPHPPALTVEQTTQAGSGTVSRVFGVMATLEEPVKKPKSGMNRLAASASDRDAWVTIITRLATRAAGGLEGPSNGIKSETPSLSDSIRQSLYVYILEDFRKRIDIAVAWLCEEWYNDKIQQKLEDDPVLHYEKWAIKLFDGFSQYLDAMSSKVLTRFLGEIPELSSVLLAKVKALCRDPAMVNLALTSLLYLVMMRPPVRDEALDAVESIWQTCKNIFPYKLEFSLIEI